MQMKIKEKMIAVVMAFAMMFTFIFAGESSEVIAAAKTKALEINVDFARNAASGDDSGIYVKSLISNKKITFGKTYVFQTKIYVPAVYMKTGRIWVKPTVNFLQAKMAIHMPEWHSLRKKDILMIRIRRSKKIW